MSLDAVQDQRQRPVVGVDADRAVQRLQRPRDARRVVGLQLQQRLAGPHLLPHARRPDDAGGGPADVVELTLALAREMLAGAGRSEVDPADALRDGRAMDVWRRMIAAQGGDPDAPLPTPAETHVVTAPATGTLTRLDAFSLGVAAWRLGAGRARKEDPVSAAAGVLWRAGVGSGASGSPP